VLIVGVVRALLAWRVVRDRAEERALAVRAEVQSAVNRALEGHEAWNPVITHAPKDYEVLLRHATRAIRSETDRPALVRNRPATVRPGRK
jgi:hypothetical protein